MAIRRQAIRRRGLSSASRDSFGADLDRLQILARLEPDHFGGGNDHFLAGSRIATDTGFARANVEDTEPTQFDSLASLHRALHGLEDCLHSDLGSRLALRPLKREDLGARAWSAGGRLLGSRGRRKRTL